MREPILVLMLAVLVCLSLAHGSVAQTAPETALSAEEARFADCVGGALAIESLWRTELAGEPNALSQAATFADRGDRLLHVATMRYVGAGHLAPFQRRAAVALAATRLRFAALAPMIPDPSAILRQMAARHAADCDPLMPP